MGGAAAKVGLSVVKGLFSPVGICIIAIIMIVFMGVNPLFLGFDLIIKSMNILSGNAMVKMALDGTFDAKSPIFIIYITVFIASFVIMIFKLFKNSLQDLALTNDLKNKNETSVRSILNGSKMKWIIIWFVSWFILPFFFGIILFVLNLFVGLFALTPLSISVFEKYTISDWDTSLTTLTISINNEIGKVNAILNLFFPNEIDKVSELPNFLNKSEVTLEQWKIFLTSLSSNAKAIEMKDGLLALNTKLNLLLSMDLFQVRGEGIVNTSIEQMQKFINDFAIKVNEIQPFIKDKIQFNDLEIAFNTIAKQPNINWNQDVLGLLNKELISSKDTIYNIQGNIAASFDSTKLPLIRNAGIEGQKIEIINGINKYQADTLTLALVQALYQNPNINSMYMTIGNSASAGSIFGQIPIFGSSIANFVNLTQNLTTILSNPLALIDVSISTFALAFCFTTFFSLLLMFAKKLFEYVSMLAMAPFATSAGIVDGGDKFNIWWKTLFGKMIVVFAISISLSIFTAILNIAGKFLSEQSLIFTDENSLKSMDDIYRKILIKFLLMTIVIASSSEMLNFIGWVGQTFNVDNRVDKYRNNFTQKQAALGSRVKDGLNEHRQEELRQAKLATEKSKKESWDHLNANRNKMKSSSSGPVSPIFADKK